MKNIEIVLKKLGISKWSELTLELLEAKKATLTDEEYAVALGILEGLSSDTESLTKVTSKALEVLSKVFIKNNKSRTKEVTKILAEITRLNKSQKGEIEEIRESDKPFAQKQYFINEVHKRTELAVNQMMQTLTILSRKDLLNKLILVGGVLIIIGPPMSPVLLATGRTIVTALQTTNGARVIAGIAGTMRAAWSKNNNN